MLGEPASLRVAIATSCDAVSSRNRQDLIHSLVPPHYVSWSKSVAITNNVIRSNPAHDETSWIQHYVIKFVSDMQQFRGFLRILRFSSANKTGSHDITEILLKVTLNTLP
jgi:hypothetical protein